MKPELVQNDIQNGTAPALNLVVNNIPYTVDQNMKSAVSLLYPIALMNHDTNLQQVYFEPEKGAAIAGFRRQVANFGVMLVRAQYGRNNEIEFGKNDFVRYNCAYNYVKRQHIETNEGLLGGEVKEGFRERVTDEIAIEKINAIKNDVAMKFEVELSPYTLFKFMESRFRDYGSTRRDRKFNIEFCSGLPAGTAKALAVLTPEGVTMVTKVPTLGGAPKEIVMFVDKTSDVAADRIQPGRVYLIKPVSYDKKTGVRTVNVLRMYVEGVRSAIQSFKMGLIKPGDKAYSVNPDKTNGIKETMVMDMPFMKTQNPKMIVGAPMLTFDLDMMYSLMKTLSGYPVVKMKFKDSSSGVYFKAEGNDTLPDIEAIVGPTIQYVRGRVWLP